MILRRLPAGLLLILGLLPAPAWGQAGDSAVPRDVSGFVPPGHWSLAAVDRLHALGLAPAGTHRGERSRTVGEVYRVLRAAADASPAGATGGAAATGYLARLEAEFPGAAGGGEARLGHAHAGAGVGTLDGDVRPGRYADWAEESWTGVTARADRTRAAGEASVSVMAGRHLAAGGSAHGGPDRTRIDELYATAGSGSLGLWAGRRAPGWGVGSAGVAYEGGVPVDGGGLRLEPTRLPWLLRHLGPARLELALARLPANGPMEHPWLVLTRGSIEPHPRVGLGVTRAAMAGALGDEELNGSDILKLLIGKHIRGSQFDNQVVSVEGWLRPPLGAALLALVYVEWGFEDSAGAWKDVPGIVAGAELPAVPGLPWLLLRLEHAQFSGSGSGNPPWYRHPIGLHEGWTVRGELAGHPLGGHGREWRGHASVTAHDARLLLGADAYTRLRHAENLYAPERAGHSTGASVRADVALGRGLALRLRAEHEDGADWARTAALLLLRLYVPGGSTGGGSLR